MKGSGGGRRGSRQEEKEGWEEEREARGRKGKAGREGAFHKEGKPPRNEVAKAVAAEDLRCCCLPLRRENLTRASTRTTFMTPTSSRRTRTTFDKVSCHSQTYRSYACLVASA
uniref:Uncharacterized protein n=1 Tax=Setaria viridis TaxID=4556 RepID=A0A4U6VG80_SETVI|nr:hypothetical protein SEVIR_3G339861v2 [Setaria viridis]